MVVENIICQTLYPKYENESYHKGALPNIGTYIHQFNMQLINEQESFFKNFKILIYECEH